MNLSEVIVRPDDTTESLKKKVELATIVGTLQSTLTDFRYLRSCWRRNCEEERLLGVSLTGICDNPAMGSNAEGIALATMGLDLETLLSILKDVAVKTNRIWAEILGIPQSTAITCVKPSGTVSQLVDSASGIHPRYAPYYIRRVRNDKKDPISQLLIDQGIPYENDVTNSQTYVFSFPIKSPDSAIVVKDMGAMDQLNLWKNYAANWCEHKPSMTCYYKDSEFLDIGAWVWKNLDSISGISFLPYSDHVYKQAPYEEITEKQYNSIMEKMPASLDWSKLSLYENEDNTSGSQTLACAGNTCEI